MISLLLFALVAQGDWSQKWEITLETRAFQDDDLPQTQDYNSALFGRGEVSWKKNGWKFLLRGFGRLDVKDHDRDFASLEEAFLSYRKSGWEVRAGYQMLNWSATEAFHPSDSVNSRNLDSRLENPEKLGEPMLSVSKTIRYGALTAYWLPYATDPEFPSQQSRLNFLPGFLWQDPVWIDKNAVSENRNDQFGLRFTQNIGDGDIAIHFLDHMDRNQFVPLTDFETLQVTPYFFRVHEWGLTHQHVLGSWLIKLESAYKSFQGEHTLRPDDQTQVALGMEYGWVNRAGASPTLIMELQGYFGLEESERLNSIFQRDVLLGYRHAFNDAQSRELLVTMIHDLEGRSEWLFNSQYQQRIGETWQIQFGLRVIDSKNQDQYGLNSLRNADQLFFNITKYF